MTNTAAVVLDIFTAAVRLAPQVSLGPWATSAFRLTHRPMHLQAGWHGRPLRLRYYRNLTWLRHLLKGLSVLTCLHQLHPFIQTVHRAHSYLTHLIIPRIPGQVAALHMYSLHHLPIQSTSPTRSHDPVWPHLLSYQHLFQRRPPACP